MRVKEKEKQHVKKNNNNKNKGLKIIKSLVDVHIGHVNAFLVSVRSRLVLVVFYAVVVPLDLFLQYLMFDLQQIKNVIGQQAFFIIACSMVSLVPHPLTRFIESYAKSLGTTELKSPARTKTYLFLFVCSLDKMMAERLSAEQIFVHLPSDLHFRWRCTSGL
jgi:hypothetical protein